MRIPPLHLVTDDQVLERPDFLDRASEAIVSGGEHLALHVRGPGLGGRRLFHTASALMAEVPGRGAWILVNDRVDVALAAGARGAHLGGRSLSVRDARSVSATCGRTEGNFVFGASVHDRAQARSAVEDGASYLMVGTLFETPSHPGRSGAGPSHLSAIREGCAPGTCPPLVGIGGITPDRVRPVLEAGGDGVAVIRGVWDSPDIAGAVTRYLVELEPLL